MQARQSSILATLRAMQGFLDDKPDTFASLKDCGARRSLDALVQQLTIQAVDQDAGRVGSRGETSLQTSLRETLRDSHMKPITVIARARLHHVPEMSAFMLPQSRTSSLQLVAMAGGMADAATKHSAVFIERGLAPHFVARLTAAAAALNQSLDTRAKSRGRSSGATTALSGLAKEAAKVIKELDALVKPLLARDDRLLGEWSTAKRIRRKSGRTTEGTAPMSPVAPSPSSPTPEEKPAA